MNCLMWWLFLLLAETPEEHAARIRAQMEMSITAQRDAIRTQDRIVRSASPRQSFSLTAARRVQPSVILRPPPLCQPLSAWEVGDLVNAAAERQRLNPSLLREVARQESGFNPCAISNSGAVGLMQLMPVTQIDLGVTDPLNAKQSIEAGSRLLRGLLDHYHGDLALALSAYNAGVGRVDESNGIPAETRNYVDSILDRLLPVINPTPVTPLTPKSIPAPIPAASVVAPWPVSPLGP